MIQYCIDPLENASVHLDLTLVQSGILSRLLNLYCLFGIPFSFSQALSQISVDEDLSTAAELEKILDWYFIQEDELYRPSEKLGVCFKNCELSGEKKNDSN